MRAFMGGQAPAPAGQVVFEGDPSVNVAFEWTVPAGVYSISTVIVGAGAQAGGGLSYGNNIPVTPGEVMEILLLPCNSGGNTYIRRKIGPVDLVTARSAINNTAGSAVGGGAITASYPGGGVSSTSARNGGGGAAGYAGAGGIGGAASAGGNAAAASGGGGGGGASVAGGTGFGGPGGGVGLLGIGTTGTGGARGASGDINGKGGGGGSGGETGYWVGSASGDQRGGKYGGGCPPPGTTAGIGAIRIMWGGGRTYPNNAGDM